VQSAIACSPVEEHLPLPTIAPLTMTHQVGCDVRNANQPVITNILKTLAPHWKSCCQSVVIYQIVFYRTINVREIYSTKHLLGNINLNKLQ
jgi:hypothetical protein